MRIDGRTLEPVSAEEYARRAQATIDNDLEHGRPAKHPLSERFHELADGAKVMHDMKQEDYGAENDPFANVRATENWGMPAWVGAMMRLNDKVVRLQKVAKGGELANEGVLDSLMDIAVYALIAHVLYEEDQGLLPR